MLKTVNRSTPCPICGKPDQCSQSGDGLVCCYRMSDPVDGWWIQKRATSKDGRGYTMYIHQGQASEMPVSDGRPVTNKLFASVYQFILANFPCEMDEQKHLAKRWMKSFSNFGTMPFHNAADRSKVAQKLYELHGDAIYGVPGISKNCPSGRGSKPWIEGPEGLMIPVRDYHGEILSIMIRPRVQGDGPKYLFMSSSRHGGSSAKPTLHFPNSFRKMHEDETWITEGYLKAEILCDVHGLPTIGTPANNLEPAHWYIASNPLESWVLAYDMDTNDAAKKTTSKNLLKAFARYPDSYMKLAIWDPAKGKGLDDLLQAGGTYQILDRKDAIKYLEQYATLDDQELDEKEYYRTEWSEAKSLMGSYGKDMTFIPEWNDFLIWNGSIWEKDSYGPAILYKKHLDERLKSQLAKLAGMAREDALKDGSIKWLMSGHKLTRLNNVVSHLKSEVDMRKKVQEIPVIRNVITCPNGTVDLANGELRNPKRSDWQQAFCPTKFDPQAQCPRWLKLLDDVFLGSQPLIHYVQKLFGMAITGQPNDHVFPVFCGDGRNGKSTILGTIQQVLGSGLAGAVDSNHLCKGHQSHPTWLSSFHQKRLMVAQETSRGMELNVALVKQLTGGDMITCRRMNENEWSFHPTHTLILCTNERPNIPESNTAIWSRIALVPFKASFSVENGNLDTTLPVKILEESEGILQWLVQGAIKYRQEGLQKPDEVIQQGKEYREDNDPEQSIQAWLDQFNVPSNDWMKSSMLYQCYFDWSLKAGIKALGTKNFSIAMSKDHRGWERRTYCGCREFRPKVFKQKEMVTND